MDWKKHGVKIVHARPQFLSARSRMRDRLVQSVKSGYPGQRTGLR